MTNFELENWRRIRTQGRGLFVGKIIVRRCLWLSVPVIVTLLLTGLHPKSTTDFWSEYQFLIWIFAGATLIIGLGDGFFMWKMRERDYQRKMRLLDSEPSNFTTVRRGTGLELHPVPDRNSLN